MENTNSFITELENALNAKEQEFNSEILPEVMKNYNTQSSAANILQEALLKKRLIHHDPYNYDDKMTDIDIPDTDSFIDSEKASMLGARLTHYKMMLDFLGNYYQFNTKFLIPKKITKLTALNNTFLWGDVTPQSKSINTKCLYEMCQTVFSSSDKITASVIRSSLANLAKSEKVITPALKELSYFFKEKYKLIIRHDVLPSIKLGNDSYENISKTLKMIKKGVSDYHVKKIPFYADLITEIIFEDYGPESSKLQQNVLKNLAAKSLPKPVEQKQDIPLKPFLISGIKSIGYTAPHFNAVLEKIESNQSTLDANSGMFTKLAKAIRQAFNIKEPDKEIVIFISDPVTQNKKKDIINLRAFRLSLLTRIKTFNNILTSANILDQKLKSVSEKALLNNLSRYIADCNLLLKQIAGIDEFYKSVKDSVCRSKMRGVKIEITTIQNLVVKANQNRAEYNAYFEEKEQMKRLSLVG